MINSFNDFLARIRKSLREKLSHPPVDVPVFTGAMPPLNHAHLSDENGLPIDQNKQVLAPPIFVLEKLLEKNDGLVIGRLKRSFSDVEFLTENMGQVARLGVTKIFCNFISSKDQEMLDRYHMGEEVSDEIRNYIHNKYGKEQKGIELTTRIELYMRVIRAAKSYGIRVIGIDCDKEKSDKTSSETLMAGTIKKFNARIPGKSIVFAGAVA